MKQIKIFSLFLLAGILAFSSCSTDEDFHTATITFNGDKNLAVEVGDPISFSGTITDIEGLSSLEVTSDVGISATESLSGTEHTFSYSGTAPSAEGDYSVTFNIINSAGNLTRATASVSVTVGDPCPPTAGLTVLNIIVPANTPGDASIELAGEMNGWDFSEEFVATNRGGGVYCMVVDVADGTLFKVRRNANWDFVEKDANGDEIDNRVFQANPGGTVEITVEKWADL